MMDQRFSELAAIASDFTAAKNKLDNGATLLAEHRRSVVLLDENRTQTN